MVVGIFFPFLFVFGSLAAFFRFLLNQSPPRWVLPSGCLDVLRHFPSSIPSSAQADESVIQVHVQSVHFLCSQSCTGAEERFRAAMLVAAASPWMRPIDMTGMSYFILYLPAHVARSVAKGQFVVPLRYSIRVPSTAVACPSCASSSSGARPLAAINCCSLSLPDHVLGIGTKRYYQMGSTAG